MTKKNLLTLLGLALFLFTACEKDLLLEQDLNGVQDQTSSSIIAGNKSGENNGVSYAVKDLSVNPNVVLLNAGNVKIESSKQELSGGSLRVSGVSDELAASFTTSNILYVKSDNYAGLKKIVSVSKTGEGSYDIETVRAQLGEAFDGGSIDVSVDLYKASLAKKKELALRAGYDASHEILNLQDRYDFGNGLTYNPATNIKLLYSLQLKFSKTQILPTEFSNTFEVQLAINPQVNFVGSYNNIKEYELSQYIPQEVLDFIKEQEFEFQIPINTLGIDTLPAVLKVKDIKIPLVIEANISNESAFAYSLNGSFKVGYTVKITGVKPKVTSIYENKIVAVANPSTSETYGELLTDSKIIITPDISILDDAYSVGGDLTLGNKTTTYGHVAIPGKSPVFGSKGVNTTSLTAIVDLILLKVPVEVINTEKVLWNVGTIVKSVIYSDLRYTLGSYKDNTNILSWGINRAYDTQFTLDYKYPIIGKKIPSELIISYDVYEDNGSTKIVSIKDQVIQPTDITATSFKFRQDIPFRGKTTIKIFPPSITTTYQTKAYIKNIVIKDRNDYVYEGIYNTAKGVVEKSWEIKK
ncbi:MAG: hypothetical protein LBU22_00785 [Dysgonamonadaceae bacterium]|jgi:hypothetical protein|nr:hypothetical protein [Dysgonamonadaceae bacterium]